MRRDRAATPSSAPTFGALAIGGSPGAIDTVPGSATFSVAQPGPAGTIALAIACTGGAAALNATYVAARRTCS